MWCRALLLLAGLLLAASGPAVAQDYPNKVIRVIMPLGPGGVGDVFLRAIGQAGGFNDWSRKTKVQLTRSNGQKFIVNCEKAQFDPTKDLPVYPGDYINVPKKGPLW